MFTTSPSRSSGKAPQLDSPRDTFPGFRVIAGFCEAHRLTPRERQILTIICQGRKNAQIARELSVSDATIRLHIGNIHRKLNTTSKVDLVLGLWRWSCRTGVRAEASGN